MFSKISVASTIIVSQLITGSVYSLAKEEIHGSALKNDFVALSETLNYKESGLNNTLATEYPNIISSWGSSDGEGLVGNQDTFRIKNTPLGFDVKWVSSNEKVATINTYGVITYKEPGKVKISATLPNGTKADTTITVVDLPQPKLENMTEKQTILRGKVDIWNYNLFDITIFINGVEERTVPVSNDGSFTFQFWGHKAGTVIEARYKDQYGNYLTEEKYVGKITITSDDTNQQVDSKDYAFTVKEYTFGKSYITGTYDQEATKVVLYIDGKAIKNSALDATTHTYKVAANEYIKNSKQKVEVVMSKGTKELGRKAVKTITEDSFTVNPYTIGQSYITGTYNQEATKVVLYIDGKAVKNSALDITKHTYKIVAKGFIKNNKQKVEMVASKGTKELTRVSVPVKILK